MVSGKGSTAVLVPLLLLAAAGGARAEDHCSGTLCDFYYGSSSSADSTNATAPAPAAPQMMTVPTNPLSRWFGSSSNAQQQATAAPAGQAPAAAQPASQGNGFFHMGGGGVMDRNANGECGGTLCDLYHGHSSDADAESSEIQSINGIPASHYDSGPRPAAATEAAVAVAPASAAAEEPRPYVAPLPKTASTCASGGKDPWSCYRR